MIEVNQAVEKVLYDYMVIFIDEHGLPAMTFNDADAKYLAAKVLEAINDAEVKQMEDFYLRESERTLASQYQDND